MHRPVPTPIAGVTLRFAEPADAATILRFIRELADYEQLADQVVADEAAVRATVFGDAAGPEVVLAEDAGAPIGFALFFHNYSTFLARRGLYLEDLFVTPAARGRGVGKALLAYLARIAVERGCGRMEWAVLDWNQPAISFYEGLGARPVDEWRTFRVTGDGLANLARQFEAGSGTPQ